MTTSSTAARQHPAPGPLAAGYLGRYAAGPGAAPAAATAADLTPALGRMSVHDDPFTFATIGSFLPPDLYDAVLGGWPPDGAFTAVALDGARPGYFGTRKQMTAENTATGVTAGAPALDAARAALRNPAFVRGLFSAFSGVIEANLAGLGPAAGQPPCFKLYANVDAGNSEALGAHVDALTKLLTIVIYLDLAGAVTSASPARWGTALYPRDPAAARPLQFTPNAGLPVARQVEFAPNRAFVMPNTPGALHGVSGGEDGVTRRTLMCGYYLQQPR
jgi:hypothetical protein